MGSIMYITTNMPVFCSPSLLERRRTLDLAVEKLDRIYQVKLDLWKES
jgi:hypothetical protein